MQLNQTSTSEETPHPTRTPARREEPWCQDCHEALKAEAAQGGYRIVFLGDSLTAGWMEPPGLEVWNRSMAPLGAGAFGIGGDGTQNVLWRLADGELDGLEPKAFVLLIGTNNAWWHSAEVIAEGITAVVDDLRMRFPQARILLLGIFPRADSPNAHIVMATIREINERIARLDDGGRTVRYLELGPLFCRPDGSVSPELMPDNIHLSAAGYEVWAQAIREPLEQLLAPGA